MHVELNTGQSIFLFRIVLQGLRYLRAVVSTPLVVAYGVVVLLTLVTITSTITGDAAIIPLSLAEHIPFIPESVSGDEDIFIKLWLGISFIIYLLQTVVQLLFKIDLRLPYFSKLKFYYGTL